MLRSIAVPPTLRLGTALAGLILALVGTARQLPAESWKDASGQHTIEAEFVRVEADKVHLKRKSDGVTIQVPLKNLSSESQQLARQLSAAASPATPAGSGGDTAEAAVRTLITEGQAGNVRVLWNAYPPSYQQDVNGVIQAFGANMDAELWKGLVDLLGKGVLVLEQKKSFILAYPDLAPQAEKLGPFYDPIVDLLKTVVTSELADLSRLKTFDMSQFLDGPGQNIAGKYQALAKLGLASYLAAVPGVSGANVPDVNSVKITTLSQTEDRAQLQIVVPNVQPQNLDVVRVEGKWLPQPMVTAWPATVADRKAKLAALPAELQKKKKDALGGLFAANLILAGIQNAKTQQEFNQAIDTLKKLAQKNASAFAGAAGPKPATKVNPFDDAFGPPAKPGETPMTKPAPDDLFSQPPAKPGDTPGAKSPAAEDPFGAPPAKPAEKAGDKPATKPATKPRKSVYKSPF